MNDSQKHDGFNAVSVSERKRWKIADLTSSVGAGVLGAGIGMLLPAETQAWAIGVLLAGGALHVWACSTNIGLNRRRHADLPRQRLSGASCARGAGRAHHRYKNAASCTAPSSAYAPKLITVAASMAVLLPIMWVAGAGSEIDRSGVTRVGPLPRSRRRFATAGATWDRSSTGRAGGPDADARATSGGARHAAIRS
jgi:hypothetical protein